MKFVFYYICLQASIPQLSQYLLDVDLVFYFDVAIDQNIIKVRSTGFIKEFTEGIINIVLERGRIIKESKGYNKVFKQAKSGTEGGKLLIAFTDTYLVKR